MIGLPIPPDYKRGAALVPGGPIDVRLAALPMIYREREIGNPGDGDSHVFLVFPPDTMAMPESVPPVAGLRRKPGQTGSPAEKNQKRAPSPQ